MVWFFDSWLWWLHTMKYFQELYPQYNYTFLGDFENAPYGEKDPEWIKKQTFKNLKILFDKWCKIVILACNTAASFAIRDRQAKYPEKKVLSVTVPWIEKCLQMWYKNISVIATPKTVQSLVYPNLFDKLNINQWKNIKKSLFQIQQISVPELVPLIEQWKTSNKEIWHIVNKYCDQIDSQSECLILWCTHFPIIQSLREENLDIDIIDPWYESGIVFWEYLSNHPEIKDKLSIRN